MSVNDNVCVFSLAPELDANEALHQLDQVGFPQDQWRKLATGLRLGGETSKFNEGIDNTDKLQRLISYWIDNKDHSWQQLVDAVKSGQKKRAQRLAKNVGAIPPSKLTIVGVHYLCPGYILRDLIFVSPATVAIHKKLKCESKILRWAYPC